MSTQKNQLLIELRRAYFDWRWHLIDSYEYQAICNDILIRGLTFYPNQIWYKNETNNNS
jgi:hypothetical protein